MIRQYLQSLKTIAAAIIEEAEVPEPVSGSMTIGNDDPG
jgi:hypothetical protein